MSPAKLVGSDALWEFVGPAVRTAKAAPATSGNEPGSDTRSCKFASDMAPRTMAGLRLELQWEIEGLGQNTSSLRLANRTLPLQSLKKPSAQCASRLNCAIITIATKSKTSAAKMKKDIETCLREISKGSWIV
jgi:hypothetical protein